MNQKHRFLPFVCLISVGLAACEAKEPPISFDEKSEFSTSERVNGLGGGARIIGYQSSSYECCKFRIYVGASERFEREFQEERFPIDKHNYEFVLRMETRAKDQGAPFFVRDVPLPDFPSAKKYRAEDATGNGEYVRHIPRTLINDEWRWLEEDIVKDKQGGSIVYRLAILDKESKKEVHQGLFDKDYFQPVKFYYWHQMENTKWVYYSRYPLISVVP